MTAPPDAAGIAGGGSQGRLRLPPGIARTDETDSECHGPASLGPVPLRSTSSPGSRRHSKDHNLCLKRADSN
ncbi:hypothetical protein D4764_03G0001500 [Takifugu flavidus]|uniref:Uncharacterized protein n=1 Tax=Takifugu flavidus TaxID=433684 RepID=A0A5C6N6P9_9TELE|nr:hypothetical protein D4764_03G0001500 [Takifugu flavidus]